MLNENSDITPLAKILLALLASVFFAWCAIVWNDINDIKQTLNYHLGATEEMVELRRQMRLNTRKADINAQRLEEN